MVLTHYYRYDFDTTHSSHRPSPRYLGHQKQQVKGEWKSDIHMISVNGEDQDDLTLKRLGYFDA